MKTYHCYIRPWRQVDLKFLGYFFGYTAVEETNNETEKDPQKV